MTANKLGNKDGGTGPDCRGGLGIARAEATRAEQNAADAAFLIASASRRGGGIYDPRTNSYGS